MKKIILGIAILGVSWPVLAASQPLNLGLVRVQISSAPIALIDQTTPQGMGELIACTDCVQSALCVSTGTGKGAYVVVSSSHSIGTNASLVDCR